MGRGPLAGPVVAAAVILPPDQYESCLPDLRESKKLTAGQRERFCQIIHKITLDVGIGSADVRYIDKYNILEATRTAMRRALNNLNTCPNYVLIDAVALSNLPYKAQSIIRGDESCGSIAAASIVAKVYRDRLMIQFEEQYPGYGFVRNKGYGTPEHLAALMKLGPCPIHRVSFRPVRLAKEALS